MDWLVSFLFSDWVSVWAIHNSLPAESSGGRLESLEFFPQDRAKFWESKSLKYLEIIFHVRNETFDI